MLVAAPRHRGTGLPPYLVECAKFANAAGSFDVLSVERTTSPADVAAQLDISTIKPSVLRRTR